MDLNNLKHAPGAKKQRKRVGRGPGSGNGKTAGRGHKGQQSRSGYTRNFGFEGGQMPLHRRLPKRGFYHDKRFPKAVVNVDVLEKHFEDGAEVTSAILIEKGIVPQLKGGVKVLARGEITKKIALNVEAISPAAQAKIEAAGGTVQITAENAAAKEASAPDAAQDAAE